MKLIVLAGPEELTYDELVDRVAVYFGVKRFKLHLPAGLIKFGATVKIEEDETGKQSIYQLIGEFESDIKNKKISINSPIARALIGKEKNDVAEVNSPKGTKIYKIISVKYK